ncbi:MAG: DUF1688 family protein [Burkholderiales bacterium]|nr:DUF1688 family protein [Burkholderiales bacterium]MDE2452612.1 DUF1688 family protein [Burkholderiales bacterium]
MNESSDSLAALRDPATIRLRSAAIARAVADGRSGLFRLDRSRLAEVAERVAALTLRRFPDLNVPIHGRWRHFEAGGVDRKARFDAALAGRDVAEAARARFDLTVLAVLLDAGAGGAWRYEQDGREYRRSEGLAVASFEAFVGGAFSERADDLLRADAARLQRVDAETLGPLFQVGNGNAMVGLEGRAALLSRLGATLVREAERDGLEARPGLIYDRLVAGGSKQVQAAQLLGELLRCLGPIWTAGSRIKGVAAGDVWPHRFAGAETAAGADFTSAGYVPLHKLSQWLAYSLVEPLQWAGIEVVGLDALTGLAEYRNGGLLLDAGVIVARDARLLARPWKPADELVVEWRALTVALLDELAPLVRQRLGPGAAALTLAQLLEGGTWAAGREIAAERRAGGVPPLQIESDGTIF